MTEILTLTCPTCGASLHYSSQEEVVAAAMYLENLNFAKPGSSLGERVSQSITESTLLEDCSGLDDALIQKAQEQIRDLRIDYVIAPVVGNIFTVFMNENVPSEKEKIIFNIHRRLMGLLPKHECVWVERLVSDTGDCNTQSIAMWKDLNTLRIQI